MCLGIIFNFFTETKCKFYYFFFYKAQLIRRYNRYNTIKPNGVHKFV